MQIYMMALDTIGGINANIYDDFTHLLPQIFDVVFPADNVKTFYYINQNKEPAADKQYRTHFLTRLSSFLGLPNQKLHEDTVQSWQNLLNVFTGAQENASITRNRVRAAIIPLNILFVFLKIPLNIIKIITEFIPACLCVITIITFGKLFERLIYAIFGQAKHDWLIFPFAIIFSPILLAPQIMYFAGCCLTSAFESMKSAWIFGSEITKNDNHSGWILGSFLVGLVIAGTTIMYITAFPIAANLLIPKILPLIAHYIPQTIINGFDKIGTIISPTLSAIGSALAPILKYSQMVLMQLYTLPFLNSLSTVPALVGAGLFVGISVATIGPLINHYVEKFRSWWHYDPLSEKPLAEEGLCSDKISQQCKMLCALREPEETAPLIVAHDDLIICENHIPETNPPINPPSNKNEENNSASATTSSLFPTSPRLKTPALDGSTRSNTVIQYDTHPVRKP